VTVLPLLNVFGEVLLPVSTGLPPLQRPGLVHVCPLVQRSTQSEVMASPFAFAEFALKVAVSEAAPDETLRFGMPGKPAGVAPPEHDETVPVPIAFVWNTVNEYTVPFVRPVIVEVHGLEVHDELVVVGLPLHVELPLYRRMVVLVNALPFVLPTFQPTVTWPSPRVAVTLVGAVGWAP
jgi:hypothetical protein